MTPCLQPNRYFSFKAQIKIYFLNNTMEYHSLYKILSSTTIFNNDNNKKKFIIIILSTKYARYNDFFVLLVALYNYG